MRRLLRGLDVKFALSLAALLVIGTICFGFVQRGQSLGEADRSISALSGQLVDLQAENRRLHRQLDRIADRSARQERKAADERDELLRELLRLNEWLRSHGINVPATRSAYTGYAPRSSQSATRQSSPSPAPRGHRSPHRSPHGNSPGNSGGHSHGHHHGHGQGGSDAPFGGLPGIPTLP